jgi:hypothetical protein
MAIDHGKENLVTLVETDAAPSNPSTKFGGQPDWLGDPQWPLSAETKAPMQFVCQIHLADAWITEHADRIAYLFISGPDGGEQTWSHDEGENCVVIQSSTERLPIPSIPWPPLDKLDSPTGPTASERTFVPRLTPGGDPDYVHQENRTEQLGDPEEFKLGGTPVFIQDDDFVLDQSLDEAFANARDAAEALNQSRSKLAKQLADAERSS